MALPHIKFHEILPSGSKVISGDTKTETDTHTHTQRQKQKQTHTHTHTHTDRHTDW
jgi:hypothetical protein